MLHLTEMALNDDFIVVFVQRDDAHGALDCRIDSLWWNH